MSEIKANLDSSIIETFLQGRDPQKYIVAVEAAYATNKIDLIINDPEKGKCIEESSYKPFLWCKEEVFSLIYDGKRTKIIEAQSFYGIKIKKLTVSDKDGNVPERLENGYKYLITCNKTYNDLVNYFKHGGVDLFNKDYNKLFVMFSPLEQFFIQSGKRLFKGMDDYNDLHRFQFDLETEGLLASKNAIFQIGVRDNKGLEKVLETTGETHIERRESERENIEKFFKIINIIQPDLITGYNSENFDWPFLFERAERLSIPITELAITLNRLSKIKRKPSTIKFGGETETYNQTSMYGYNIIDISHAVRRAMAINSEIKGWGLKYITQYSEIAKPNRVYVAGDKINSTWADKVNDYAFNDVNGDWYIITENNPLKEGYVIKKGDFIVQRYLCDDLWETEQIDNIFNQASFLISKMLPTSFQRSSTMGTAGQWKLIMAAWSYENDLAIPETQSKRDFTGGLSRLLEVGYAKNVVKLDYAALYPKTQLTHSIFPDLDISGVMEGMLTYVVDSRDKFKFLTGIEKGNSKKLQKKLEEGKDLSLEEKENIKKQITEHKALANLYDKKQLPLKILANSWFGSYGAPYIFNWGDSDSAEETTCRGRQYLRLMVRHFTEKYNFKCLLLDTDGANFSFPDNIGDVKYLAKGTHWKTTDDANKELSGLDAVLAEFNENYMSGRMGLDIDDICSSTINFARKNYANDIGGKIKFVGNSIKSKKMSVYIEDFLGKAIRMLLDGDGYSFVQYYYEYVDKIYNYQIPLVKMASKAKVKTSLAEYKKKATQKNKAGNPMPKQAHMELAIKAELDITLGDTIYYINTGTSKSHGDLKSEKNKTTGLTTVNLNCNLIDQNVVEKDFEKIKELDVLMKSLKVMAIDDIGRNQIEERIEVINSELITDEYNVARYLDAFNKKVKPLLVCFDMDVRKKIILDIVKTKDKVTKKVTEKLKERTIFTKDECTLISGIPNKDSDQDSYEALMIMEDKEIKFWDKVNKIPNNMKESEWQFIRADYVERIRVEKEEGVEYEKNFLNDFFKHLEIEQIVTIETTKTLPIEISNVAYVKDDSIMLFSRRWDEPLCEVFDIFKYKQEAIERDKYYKLVSSENNESRYQEYLEYILERDVLTGETINQNTSEVKIENINTIIEGIKENTSNYTPITKTKTKLAKVSDDNEDDNEDDDSDDNEEEEFIIDEVDDTMSEIPEDYISDVVETKKENMEEAKEKDEWNF